MGQEINKLYFIYYSIVTTKYYYYFNLRVSNNIETIGIAFLSFEFFDLKKENIALRK